MSAAPSAVAAEDLIRSLTEKVAALEAAQRTVPPQSSQPTRAAASSSASSQPDLATEIAALRAEMATMRGARGGTNNFDSAADVTAALARVIGEDAAARRQVRRRAKSQRPPRRPVEPSESEEDDDMESDDSVEAAPPPKVRKPKDDPDGKLTKKRVKASEFGEPPTEVSPSMHQGFMQWLEVEVQNPMKDPLAFDAYVKKASRHRSRDVWVQKLESRGIKKCPAARAAAVAKGFRKWLTTKEGMKLAAAAPR